MRLFIKNIYSHGIHFINRIRYSRRIKHLLGVDKIAIAHLFLVDGYHFIPEILRFPGSYFTITDEVVRLVINSVIIQLENYEDLYIAHEIFGCKDYQIELPPDSILIDVGMHVGMASLFFAMQENVKQVYAFEPLPETFKQARSNICINNELVQRKIRAFNIGLGDYDKKITVDYSYAWKGCVGIMGLTEYLKKSDPNCEKIEIIIEDVTKHFSSIQKAHPHSFLVAKLDCEGAEYEIMERLYETKFIHSIGAFIIEWHEAKAARLLDLLKNSGFQIIMNGKIHDSTGIIKAFNKKIT